MQQQSEDWRSCILYFSEKWLSKLHDDRAWMKLKLYLHETAWRKFEYERNRIYYDIAFSLIQEKRNLKPNPYLTDTARHLFATAIGAVPGYVPACNEEAIPLRAIQKAFTESYGLKKYVPTIMQPAHFNFEKSTLPVYYSLQHPSTHVFSPKSRAMSNTIADMLELEYIMRIFREELASTANICSDTIIGSVAKRVAFNYFHNKSDRQKVIAASTSMPLTDPRFADLSNTTAFAADAPFVRGCVSMRRIKDVA